MTLSPFIIYLWGIADGLRDGLFIFSFLFGICAFAVALWGNIEYGGFSTEQGKKIKATFLKTVAATMICAAVGVFTPSSKTIAIMVVAPAIVNSKPIQQDLPEAYSLAVDALKSSLKDVAVEKGK